MSSSRCRFCDDFVTKVPPRLVSRLNIGHRVLVASISKLYECLQLVPVTPIGDRESIHLVKLDVREEKPIWCLLCADIFLFIGFDIYGNDFRRKFESFPCTILLHHRQADFAPLLAS
jgi:hypothetical protein